MTRPAVTFPRPNPNINNIECAAASQRETEESVSQPCHVCGHMVCGFGPDGPLPCEMCNIVIYVRLMFNRVGQLEDVGGDALQRLRNDTVAAIADARSDATTAINEVRTDATTAITALAGRTAALENTRPTNAQLSAVNNKVDTLKTRVDNATAFPI